MTLVATVGGSATRMIVVDVQQIGDNEEVVTDAYADEPVRRSQRLKEATADLLGDGMEVVRSCAERITSAVETMSTRVRPDQIEVQVQVRLDYELGAVLVAKGKAGAHLQVTMKWDLQDDAPQR